MPVANARLKLRPAIPTTVVKKVTELEDVVFKYAGLRVVIRVPASATLNRGVSRILNDGIDMNGTIASFRDVLKKALKDTVVPFDNDQPLVLNGDDIAFILPNGSIANSRVAIKNAQWPS